MTGTSQPIGSNSSAGFFAGTALLGFAGGGGADAAAGGGATAPPPAAGGAVAASSPPESAGATVPAAPADSSRFPTGSFALSSSPVAILNPAIALALATREP